MCNVKLISIEVLMVENGVTLMKLLNLGNVVDDLKHKEIFWR
jgi:hypothetical protein